MIDNFCMIDRVMAQRIAAIFYDTVVSSHNMAHSFIDDEEFTLVVNGAIIAIYGPGGGETALADAQTFMELAGNETPTD